MAHHNSSKIQILKSSAMIGGSTMVNVCFGIIRSKAAAILLGSSGLGLFSLLNSIVDLAFCISSIGVNSSGARQVAEATASNDAQRLARTTSAIRRVSVVLGLTGAILLLAFSHPIAQFTFGNESHVISVAFLGIAVFFRLIYAGQTALMQGARQISDLARLTVISGLLGTTFSVPVFYFLRHDGIVPAIVGTACISAIVSTWFARRVGRRSSVSLPQVVQELKGILPLGFAFMAGDLLSLGASYAIRMILLGHGGLAAAGLYQAAWVLGGLYVGLVLQAMAADFLPRLTAAANENAACNQLMNEQAEISMLLAVPGILGTLTFSHLVLTIFYSAEFHAAASLLRWICVGMGLRIIAWPIGYLVIARGASRLFFWAEVAATVVHVGAAWILIPRIGIEGAGVAFLLLYVWHTALVYILAARLSGFSFSAANLRLSLYFLLSTGTVFGSSFLLPPWAAIMVGSLVTLSSAVYSLRGLLAIAPSSIRLLALSGWLGRATTFVVRFAYKNG